jgi:hypothetical protein
MRELIGRAGIRSRLQLGPNLTPSPPAVQQFAAALASRFESSGVVTVGGRRALLGLAGTPHRSTVVCSSVAGAGSLPAPLLRALARAADRASVMVVTAPDPQRGGDPSGWPLDELVGRLADHGMTVEFSGYAARAADPPLRTWGVAVVSGASTPPPEAAPAAFRVCAIVPCFNERDVIAATVGRLVDQGIEVVVVDNESTDGSAELVRERFGADRVTVETWGTEGTYHLASLMGRIERLAAAHPADWIVLQDADEVRESPWPGVSLRDGLWTMQQRGFNAVDHTVVNFEPVAGDTFTEGDPAAALLHFDFGRHRGYFHQIRAWRNAGPVTLVPSGGHDAVFDGRRVAPYKFLLRHYPIRSQEHGLRKVLAERQPRFHPEDRARGWHFHYDDIDEERNFLGNPEMLFRWDDAAFPREHLIERLTGVGLI